MWNGCELKVTEHNSLLLDKLGKHTQIIFFSCTVDNLEEDVRKFTLVGKCFYMISTGVNFGHNLPWPPSQLIVISASRRIPETYPKGNSYDKASSGQITDVGQLCFARIYTVLYRVG